MEFITGNEGRKAQWQIESEIAQASREVSQSQDPQARLIGLLSEQTLNHSSHKTEDGLNYDIG
jgi:hypothetical protein